MGFSASPDPFTALAVMTASVSPISFLLWAKVNLATGSVPLRTQTHAIRRCSELDFSQTVFFCRPKANSVRSGKAPNGAYRN